MSGGTSRLTILGRTEGTTRWTPCASASPAWVTGHGPPTFRRGRAPRCRGWPPSPIRSGEPRIARPALRGEACFADPLEMLASVRPRCGRDRRAPLSINPIAAAAIGRGLHVLIEKPLVLDPADGRRLIEAARTAGVEIVVGLHVALQPAGADRAREWIASRPDRDGQLRPVVLRVESGQPLSRRAGGSTTMRTEPATGSTARSSRRTRTRVSRAAARARRS